MLSLDQGLGSEFLRSVFGSPASPDTHVVISWLDSEGIPQSAVGFERHTGNTMEASIYVKSGGIFPRSLLLSGLAYAFDQLGLKFLTFIVKSSNMVSIDFVTRLGATHEATLRDVYPEADSLVFYLRPETCPIWERYCGKRRGYTSSTGPSGHDSAAAESESRDV